MEIFTEVELRVLGSLVEKSNTTPDNYPLTLNSLVLACNQKSNRNPVTYFTDDDVLDALSDLREQGLIWVNSPVGSRTLKYSHSFEKFFDIDIQQTAVLSTLILRGPQTPGEIRGRCARIFEFATVDEILQVLQGFQEREDALAVKLPVEAGKKESRYTHLLAGEPEVTTSEDAFTEQVQRKVSIKDEKINELEARIETLESCVEELTSQFNNFKEQFE